MLRSLSMESRVAASVDDSNCSRLPREHSCERKMNCAQAGNRGEDALGYPLFSQSCQLWPLLFSNDASVADICYCCCCRCRCCCCCCRYRDCMWTAYWRRCFGGSSSDEEAQHVYRIWSRQIADRNDLKPL